MAQNQKRIVTYEDHAEQLRPMVEHRGRAKFLTPFLRSSPECAQVETKQIYQRPDYVTPQEKKNKKEMKKAGPTNPASGITRSYHSWDELCNTSRILVTREELQAMDIATPRSHYTPGTRSSRVGRGGDERPRLDELTLWQMEARSTRQPMEPPSPMQRCPHCPHGGLQLYVCSKCRSFRTASLWPPGASCVCGVNARYFSQLCRTGVTIQHC